jgi:hypothetical protein
VAGRRAPLRWTSFTQVGAFEGAAGKAGLVDDDADVLALAEDADPIAGLDAESKLSTIDRDQFGGRDYRLTNETGGHVLELEADSDGPLGFI